MSGIVSLIFKDNTELPFNQYDKSMSKKVEFIKIYVPDNTLFILQDTNEHHEIILHKHLLINDNNGYYYNYNNYNVENIKNSEIFNGYNINQSIKDAICQEPIESKKKSPFSYINDINKHTTNYEAYIPSIWELQFIYKNADIINLII